MSVNTIPLDLDALMFVRLLIAVGLGALIGYERNVPGKPAGVRTHGTGTGSALFTVGTLRRLRGRGRSGTCRSPGSGWDWSFQGRGAILHWHQYIEGLTTAASLWVTAAIGLAVGVGMIWMSVGSAILVFVLLRFVPASAEKRIKRNRMQTHLHSWRLRRR